MRKKTKNTLFLSIIAIIVAGAIIGYRIWNEPHRNIKNASAVNTTATALYNNLTKDSARTKSAFSNRVLLVSGVVKQVSMNQKGQQVILLQTDVADGSVNCTMEEKSNGIKTGDPILIKGICIGYIGGDTGLDLPGDVFLIRCYRSI